MATEKSLELRYKQIRKQYADYTEHTPLSSEHDYAQAGVIWGEHQGNRTPSALLIALEPGHWEFSREDKLDQLAYELLASLNGDWPVFAPCRTTKTPAATAYSASMVVLAPTLWMQFPPLS